jgi:hypothetical protein
MDNKVPIIFGKEHILPKRYPPPDSKKYRKVECMSIEQFMKEFDMEKDEVINAMRVAAEMSTTLIFYENNLYEEIERDDDD